MVCALKTPPPQLHPLWLPHTNTVFSHLPSLCPLISFMPYVHSPLFQCPGYPIKVPPNLSSVVTCLLFPCLSYSSSPSRLTPSSPIGPSLAPPLTPNLPGRGRRGPAPRPSREAAGGGDTLSSSLHDLPLPCSPSPTHRHPTYPPHEHQSRLLPVSVRGEVSREGSKVSPSLMAGASRCRHPSRPSESERTPGGRSPR